ncbi:hypothetical protein MMC22_009734 [Lobaria immixta]|nr:hypothetical protein [Lobaria immixta]
MCKDDLFQLQPVVQLTDSEILKQYETLCQLVSNWVDDEISRFEDKFGAAAHDTEASTGGGSSYVKKVLNSVPGADEYLVSTVIHMKMQEAFFGEGVILFGLDPGIAGLVLSTQQHMAKLQPERDIATINTWRSETLKAMATIPEMVERRKMMLSKFPTDLFHSLQEILPGLHGEPESKKQLHRDTWDDLLRIGLGTHQQDAESGGLEGITSDKVPTEVQYDGQDFKWGFQIRESELRHQWFKLDLDPLQHRGTSNLPAQFPDPAASPPGFDESTERIVTDYLTALRKHAERILRYKLPASALLSTPIEFVITMPAVWSDVAQAKARTCAQNAGMGLGSALYVISEPEAAAMYALDAMDPHNIKVGDTSVLVDAGGGSVDLISYTVTTLKPLLQVTQASPGSGSLCGSALLNRIFQKFLKDRFGSDESWDDDVLEEATRRFELLIKRSFRGAAGERFMVPVPGLLDNPGKGVFRGKFLLTGAEVEAIFKPVVQEVIKLVLGQIKATKNFVTAVLLVGGFGQNAYLRDQIRAAIGGVELMRSPDGWLAVARGALMKGLASTSLLQFASVSVSGRSARRNYGIDSTKPFDISIHDWSHWFIKKGQTVEEDKPFRLGYTKTHWVSYGKPSILTVDIYACADPDNNGAPMYLNSNVVKVVELNADFGLVPKQKLLQKVNPNGVPYYEISLQIEVTCFSAYTKYELIHDNINYGAVSAEYV